MSPDPRESLQRVLLQWYAEQGRDLPWRRTRDPYQILVAEVMLQQTQVERVLPKYRQFLQRFPTLLTLAQASVRDVIVVWAPLGYNRRAVYLHRAAQQIMERYGGELPPSVEELRRLPGIGRNTAAAVACFAYGLPEPVLDTNVRRVLGRLFGEDETSLTLMAQETLARWLLPAEAAYVWNQALMDLGATVCHALQPQCWACPVAALCAARPRWEHRDTAKAVREPPARYRPPQPFRGSRRYYRGRILEVLRGVSPGAALHLKELGQAIMEGFQPHDMPWLHSLLTQLQREGLVALHSEDGLGPDALETVTVSLPH